MSSPIIIPFDNNPVSTIQRTASYTIPVGRFALAKTISPFFSLNGVNQFPSQSFVHTVPASTGGTSATSSWIVPHGSYMYSASASAPTGGQFYSYSWGVGSNTSYTTAIGSRSNNGALAVGFIPSTVLWASSSNAGINAVGTLSLSFYFFASSLNEFWVPQGTVLNGNNYVVSEYNRIS